jgi:hypothetical protein
MKMRILGMAIGISALWGWSPGCSQPVPECTVGTAAAYPYATKFTLRNGTPPCDGIPFDYVGMQIYNPVAADGVYPDLSQKLVSLQLTAVGDVYQHAVAFDEGRPPVPYALGAFQAIEPDANNLCYAPTMDPASLYLPFVPGEGGSGGTGGAGGAPPPPPPLQEETDIGYQVSNLTIYVTPANLGNQFEADITYRDNLAMCDATYHVFGLWPAVACEELAFFTADCAADCAEGCTPCDPAASPDCVVVNTCRPNNALCDAVPDPEPPYEIPFGSGISPDLQVECDPDIFHCLPVGGAIQAVPIE